MARVGRLAGAILAESHGEYFLVGDTKSPCDWKAAGFEPPVALDALKAPFVRLARCGEVSLGTSHLVMDLEGFVIERNGSVSDRLWRLVIQRGDTESTDEPEGAVDARWLGEIPSPLWQIVRDTVLRCL
jgi:hypothetical protein